MTVTLAMSLMLAGWLVGAPPPTLDTGHDAAEGAPIAGGGLEPAAAVKGCSAQDAGPGHQVFDRKANALMRVALEPGRGGSVEGRSADLEFGHEVTVDGTVSIRLMKGADLVSLRLASDSFEFRRGDRVVTVSRSTAAEPDLLAVETLLAGSPAVRAFRGMAASLEPATWRTAAGVGVQLADVIVGLFQGDTGATERMINRIKLARRPVRQVRQDRGCFENYEAEISRAWDDWAYCVVETWGVWRDVCNWRMVLWAESAWFGLIGCSAIPIRAS